MTTQTAWAIARDPYTYSLDALQEALGILESDGRNPNLVLRLRCWIGHIIGP